MPFIMGLEGPRPSTAQMVHGELLGAVPRPWWRLKATLDGIIGTGGRSTRAAAAATGPENCCWTCACSGNVCCDDRSPASVARHNFMHALTTKAVTRSGAPLRGLGLFQPIQGHPWLVIGGVLLGAWLAGSSKGRALTKRYLPRRK